MSYRLHQRDRAEVERLVAEFIARGGTIKVLRPQPCIRPRILPWFTPPLPIAPLAAIALALARERGNYLSRPSARVISIDAFIRRRLI